MRGMRVAASASRSQPWTLCHSSSDDAKQYFCSQRGQRTSWMLGSESAGGWPSIIFVRKTITAILTRTREGVR